MLTYSMRSPEIYMYNGGSGISTCDIGCYFFCI